VIRAARRATLASVLVVATACAGDDSALRAPTIPSSVDAEGGANSAPPANPRGRELIERYVAFWDARFDANSDPVNPEDLRLRELATGSQLDRVVAETQRNRNDGLAFRRPQNSVGEHRVDVVEIRGGVAALQDCVTNDGIVYRVATGAVVDETVVTRSLLATMRRVDGVWKLAETRQLEQWEGVAGCAVSSDF
jgi:hypothetical protein